MITAATILRILREETANARARDSANTGTVTLESLDRLISDLDKRVAADEPPSSLTPALMAAKASAVVTQAELEHASGLAKYRADAEGQLEVFKSVLTSATLAIKTLTLINGGSAVALLAFIGHLATAGDHGGIVPKLAGPLISFVLGAGGAALTAGTVCLAQKSFAWRLSRTGNLLVLLSIIIGLASLGLFFFGTWQAYPIFRNVSIGPGEI